MYAHPYSAKNITAAQARQNEDPSPETLAQLVATLEAHPLQWACDGELDYCPTCEPAEGAHYPCTRVRNITSELNLDLGD